MSLPSEKNNITVVYNKFCPYAQRALIVALEKDLNATFRQVSLGEKQVFFKETYAKALGKNILSEAQVPILIDGDKIICQSQLVCYYMAEKFTTGSNLIPKEPIKRFKMRLLINRQVKSMIDLFNRAKTMKIQDIQQYNKLSEKTLSSIQSQIQGKYFLGEDISLVDTLIYPWFERWIILQHYLGVKIDQRYKKIKTWLNNMNNRRSIIQTKKLTNNEYYITRASKTIFPKL